MFCLRLIYESSSSRPMTSSNSSVEPNRADIKAEQNSSSAVAVSTVAYNAHSADDGISHPIDARTGIGSRNTEILEAMWKRFL